MNKKRAKEVLLAYTCCSFNWCYMCPWNGTYDCENTKFSEKRIRKAVRMLGGNDMSRKMKLSYIKIKESFAITTPKEEKMEECRNNWNTYHRQDRYIVINTDNELIDGYIQYLVLKENGVEEADIKISNKCEKRWYRKNVKDWTAPSYKNEETTYVYGVHPNRRCNKTFIWRVPKGWTWFAENVQIGDSILCDTRFGIAPVIVTKIEVLDKCPVDFVVKRVIGKEIRRNGYVVKV